MGLARENFAYKFTLLQYCNKFTVMQIKLVVVVVALELERTRAKFVWMQASHWQYLVIYHDICAEFYEICRLAYLLWFSPSHTAPTIFQRKQAMLN